MINIQKYSSWISVIGLPNAGKSTLFNSLIGTKLSIVTPKSQTTRNTLKGIKIIDDTQLVFIDTPGFLKPKKKLEKFMHQGLTTAINDSDQILFIHDATKNITAEEEHFLRHMMPKGENIMLVLNKIDKVEKNILLAQAKAFQEIYSFSHIFMISALKKQGLDILVETLKSQSKNLGWFFEEDQLTTAPVTFLIQEIIREKILFNTHQEIPYNVFLETEIFEESNDLLKTYVTILVPTENQKKILLGKQGSLIKKISMQARFDLEKILGTKLFIKTYIKVKDWEKKLTDHKFINY